MDAKSIYIALTLLAAAISGGLILFVAAGPPSRLARSFITIAAANAIWAVGYAGELASSDVSTMITLAKFQYFGIALLPLAWIGFALTYSSYDHLLKPRYLAAAAVLPLMTLALVMSNELHDLHWQSAQTELRDGWVKLVLEPGPAYYIFTAYSYFLMAGATYLVLRTALRTGSSQRTGALFVVASWMVVWVSNFFYLVGINPTDGYNLTTPMLALTLLAVGYFVFDFRIVGTVPLAMDTIINSMSDGMIIVDAAGRVVEINQVACKLLKVTQEKCIGKSPGAVLEDHEHLYQTYQSLLQLRAEEDRRDEAMIMNDGQTHHVEVGVIDLKTRSLRDVGHILRLIDITTQMNAQYTAARRFSELSALRFIDERMTSTLEIDQVLETALRSAIDMTGADSGFIAMIEADKHRIVQTAGNNVRNIGDRIPNNQGITGRVIRKMEAELVEHVRNDPDYRPYHTNASAQIAIPLISHDKVIGVLSLETNKVTNFTEDNFAFAQMLGDRITVAIENAQLYSTSRQQVEELKKLYDHVSELERTKTDMIRMASHDLRNPLGTLLGYIDLLEMDKSQLTEEHAKYVRMMLELGERMQGIVNDILSLERMEAAEITMRKVDIQRLVIKAVDSCKTQFSDKKLSVEKLIPDAPVMIWGDPVQIYEAIHNLLENAIKYTPEGGRIEIMLEKDSFENKAIFEVTDNGVGIPQHLQERLFEPFYRADRGEIREIEGTGLGLHLVKNIVERHHGSVRFRSAPNQGSMFGFDVILSPL